MADTMEEDEARRIVDDNPSKHGSSFGPSRRSPAKPIAEEESSMAESSFGPPRRSRRADPDAATRGRRMFGLLNSTLNKANEDNARRTSGEAGRKRAELEQRMKEKAEARDKRIELERDLRHDVRRAYDLAIELHADDDAFRLRKAQKRRMASFLVTGSELTAYDGEQARKSAVDQRSLAHAVPVTLAPVTARYPAHLKRPDGHPIYFLPKNVLPAQEDKLDEQEDAVDAEIDKTDAAWEKMREERQARLDALLERIREARDAMEGKTPGMEGKDEDVAMNGQTVDPGDAKVKAEDAMVKQEDAQMEDASESVLREAEDETS